MIKSRTESTRDEVQISKLKEQIKLKVQNPNKQKCKNFLNFISATKNSVLQ